MHSGFQESGCEWMKQSEQQFLQLLHSCCHLSPSLLTLTPLSLFFSPHSEKQKSLSVSGIVLPPRVIVGQKGRVTVSIEGRRVDRVQTAWFLNDTLINDTSFTGKSFK